MFLFGLITGGRAIAVPVAAAPAALDGEYVVDDGGQAVFVLGASYEGPSDRAWRMWDDDQFDSTLINRDFERARAANLSVLRIFVQRSLAADIRAERWSKLDRVLELADRSGLRLILTFADYEELDVSRLAQVDAAVAARYRGRPTIFAYDLKNEPRFWDLVLGSYPRGVRPPLHDPAWVPTVGETLARADVAEYRASEQGRREVPARLSDDQAYVYANLLAAYRRFLGDSEEWARARNSTVVRYLFSPDSSDWHPLFAALDDTLAAWIEPRLRAIRTADPDRPITLAHADAIIASLSANGRLDYRTLHRYPAASDEGIARGMAVFDDVRAVLPTKPLMLGEFGFSNADVDEEQSARLELQIARAVCDRGGAGALKWMLNDFPSGANPRQNAFGLYRGDGSAKPVVEAFRGLGRRRPLAPPLAADVPSSADHNVCG